MRATFPPRNFRRVSGESGFTKRSRAGTQVSGGSGCGYPGLSSRAALGRLGHQGAAADRQFKRAFRFPVRDVLFDRLKRRSARAWKHLFDSRSQTTEWPHGSGVWGKRELVCLVVETRSKRGD
jgi:hypothetical protein